MALGFPMFLLGYVMLLKSFENSASTKLQHHHSETNFVSASAA
jgi:hypothetical protein